LEVLLKIIFEKNAQAVITPCKGHFNDSGIDIFTTESFVLKHGERKTISLHLRFALELPWYMKFLHLFGLGIEAQVRPKSGRTLNGIDVALGTIDEGYRNFTGATIINFSGKTQKFEAGEKICQIVFVPTFNRVKLVEGKVDTNTSRGLGGFGSTGLKKSSEERIKSKTNTNKNKFINKFKYYCDKIFKIFMLKHSSQEEAYFGDAAIADTSAKISTEAQSKKMVVKMQTKQSSKPVKNTTTKKQDTKKPSTTKSTKK